MLKLIVRASSFPDSGLSSVPGRWVQVQNNSLQTRCAGAVYFTARMSSVFSFDRYRRFRDQS